MSKLRYQTLTIQRKQEARQVCSQVFIEQPLTAAINGTANDWKQAIDIFMDQACTNKISVVVLDESRKIIGGALNTSDPEMGNNLKKLYGNYKTDEKTLVTLVQFVLRIDSMGEQLMEHQFKRQMKGANCFLLFVLPQYRKLGIANKIIQQFQIRCRNQNIDYMTTEATNFYTSVITKKNGWKEYVVLDSHEYTFKGRHAFQKVGDVHRKMRFLGKILRQ